MKKTIKTVYNFINKSKKEIRTGVSTINFYYFLIYF